MIHCSCIAYIIILREHPLPFSEKRGCVDLLLGRQSRVLPFQVELIPRFSWLATVRDDSCLGHLYLTTYLVGWNHNSLGTGIAQKYWFSGLSAVLHVYTLWEFVVSRCIDLQWQCQHVNRIRQYTVCDLACIGQES